ncbi:hypothetical protein [Oceanicoccus sagamiensis]|uniref:Uncharacterized protein n=1 Tax=Oceanicoccus sagamiensis TaxID=716816 RepID=A0A1X9N5Y1_9GAMM|nr:hypothetical protein [Oceanicoccus sagamiensis]ARN72681.1 hypothetical protein BST96_00265 [Oceanicoccus sagamiensis]
MNLSQSLIARVLLALLLLQTVAVDAGLPLFELSEADHQHSEHAADHEHQLAAQDHSDQSCNDNCHCLCSHLGTTSDITSYPLQGYRSVQLFYYQQYRSTITSNLLRPPIALLVI